MRMTRLAGCILAMPRVVPCQLVEVARHKKLAHCTTQAQRGTLVMPNTLELKLEQGSEQTLVLELERERNFAVEGAEVEHSCVVEVEHSFEADVAGNRSLLDTVES
jgi:hypothetical protein